MEILNLFLFIVFIVVFVVVFNVFLFGTLYVVGLPILLISIVAHEFGHAFAGLAMGLSVKEIHIGSGSVIATIPLGFARLICHSNLFLGGGFVVPGEVRKTDFKYYKLRQAVFLLGGPLASILLLSLYVWLLFYFLDTLTDIFRSRAFLNRMIAWTAAMLIFIAIYDSIARVIGSFSPRTYTVDGQNFASDGLALWHLFRITSGELKCFWHSLRAYAHYVEGNHYTAYRHMRRMGPQPDPAAVFVYTYNLSLVRSFDRPLKDLDALWTEVESLPLTQKQKCMVVDAIASVRKAHPQSTKEELEIALASLDQGLLLDADTEDLMSLRSSRGGVLAELGKNEEARLDLEKSLAECTSSIDLIHCNIGLARICAANGEFARARTFLDQYDTLSQDPMLERRLLKPVRNFLDAIRSQTVSLLEKEHADASSPALEH